LIYVGPPDRDARREMLAFHLRGRPVASDLPVDLLAETLGGYSASDLQFLVNEAARSALKKRVPISMESFVSAMERIQASVTPEIEAQYQNVEQRGF
jgi:SpoVK/Ycf46/Vps4 family AAA+-type ATPase